MKKLIWVLPALVLIGIGLWDGSVIMRWDSMDKTLPEIPDYTSYNKAVGTDLPEQLSQKAEAAECSGYVLPIENISGPAPSGLIEDLNLSLAAYPNWYLRVGEDEQEKMKARWESKVADWGSLMTGRDIEEFLTTIKIVDFKTEYSIVVNYFDELEDPVNTRKIILKVQVEANHSLFSIPVVYTDLKTISSWKNARDAKKNSLMEMENKVKTIKVVLKGSSIIVGFIYLILIIIVSLKIRKSAKRRKAYLLQIEKREELINDGHYTAALELSENYLSYFPDDVEIKAFKQRILVFCGGDTYKAEEAFVHAAKLKVILETIGEEAGRTMTVEEKSQITALLPYNENLKESYGRFLAIEDKRNAENTKKRKELLEALSKNVDSINIAAAREALNILEQMDPELAELKDWKKLLSPDADNIILRRNDGKQVIYCVTKADLLIGRYDDDNTPDIALNSNRVSRRHLQLSFLDDKLIAEDLGSANGTFVNGEKITSVSLSVGDTLNIGKVMDFTVSGGTKNNHPMALHNAELSVCFVTGALTFSAGPRNVEIDRIGDLFWINNGKQEIIKVGQTVSIGSYKYTVEELQWKSYQESDTSSTLVL